MGSSIKFSNCFPLILGFSDPVTFDDGRIVRSFLDNHTSGFDSNQWVIICVVDYEVEENLLDPHFIERGTR